MKATLPRVALAGTNSLLGEYVFDSQFREALLRSGFEWMDVEDPRQPDVVVSPWQEGAGALDRYEGTPVLAVVASNGCRLGALEAGATDCLSYPFLPVNLLERINRLFLLTPDRDARETVLVMERWFNRLEVGYSSDLAIRFLYWAPKLNPLDEWVDLPQLPEPFLESIGTPSFESFCDLVGYRFLDDLLWFQIDLEFYLRTRDLSVFEGKTRCLYDLVLVKHRVEEMLSWKPLAEALGPERAGAVSWIRTPQFDRLGRNLRASGGVPSVALARADLRRVLRDLKKFHQRLTHKS
ncbi:MAG: hypothetical protein QF752_13970 [Planctomycetota bacterium]|nr:hypothetical protein [Planctomycetota bacterium]